MLSRQAVPAAPDAAAAAARRVAATCAVGRARSPTSLKDFDPEQLLLSP